MKLLKSLSLTAISVMLPCVLQINFANAESPPTVNFPYAPIYYAGSPPQPAPKCLPFYTEDQRQAYDSYQTRQLRVLSKAWQAAVPGFGMAAEVLKADNVKSVSLSPPIFSDEAVFFFQVDRQGNLLEARLLKASQNTKNDTENLTQLKKLFPARPLPPTITARTVNLILSPSIAQELLTVPSKSAAETKLEDTLYERDSTIWVNKVIGMVKQQWATRTKIKDTQKARIIATFINQSGFLADLQIIESACDAVYDHDAMETVWKLRNRFPKPVPDHYRGYTKVELTFDRMFLTRNQQQSFSGTTINIP